MKHTGSPSNFKDLNLVFALFAAILTIDIIVLVSYTFHLLLMINVADKPGFGWVTLAFCLFGAPYFSPILAILASCTGNDQLIKTMGNMNSIMIAINVPLTLFFSY